jgi:hypothetical protein
MPLHPPSIEIEGYEMEDLHEFHKTNDMALATFLKMNGHATQKTLWEGGTCYWYFRLSDGLVTMIDTFVDGRARVEPREYNRTFTQTKREFHAARDEN